MALFDARPAKGQEPDAALVEIANYVADYYIGSNEAFTTARFMLLDAIACAMLALRQPECVKHVGPAVPGAVLPGGVKVPGTAFELDPAQAAYSLGTQIAWLGLNDAWEGADSGHPSENFGALLAVADYSSRRAQREGGKPLVVRDLLAAAIKAYEVQGVHALRHGLAARGFDPVIFLRVSATALATSLLGGGKDEIISAVSHAWLDAAPVGLYRQRGHLGERRAWASGDACRRAVHHAMAALKGVPGHPDALSAKGCGVLDVIFGGGAPALDRRLGSYVMENVAFVIGHPVDVHAHTAVDAALALHPLAVSRLADIERITVETHGGALRHLGATTPPANVLDRLSSLSWIVASALLRGRIAVDDAGDTAAADPRLEALRSRVELRENPAFTVEADDPDRRHLGSAVQIQFRDGSHSERVAVDFPLGHRHRRSEAVPVVLKKFEDAISGQLPAQRVRQILELTRDTSRFESTPVHRFLDLFSFA